jgi:hypothetical protein
VKSYTITILLLPFTLIHFALNQAHSQVSQSNEYFPKQEIRPAQIPAKHNLWVFILAGQSNMAGRGLVEPQDTIPNPRILSINAKNEIIIAKEPLHWYEPKLTGLDCGVSFARTLLSSLPDSVSILLLPTAIGGSSITQWLEDREHRGVHLLSNLREKALLGMQYGQIKGILWHQGESDSGAENLMVYAQRLTKLVAQFRDICKNPELRVIVGELGEFGGHPKRAAVNKQLKKFVESDRHSAIISTQDLDHKGDGTHFNSKAQRLMGVRYAKAFFQLSQH